MPGLTRAQMIGLLNATLSAYMKGKFVGTQQLQQFAGVEKFIMSSQRGISLDGHSFTWSVAMRANTGSFRAVNFHEAWNALEGPAPVQASVNVAMYEGKGIVVDSRERTMNAGQGQIIDIVKQRTDRFFRAVFEELEADIFRLPTGTTDTKRLMSLWKWARPSMSAAGAYVADTTGGFNGTYIRYSDGTTGDATLAGIDASNVNNAEWRNWVFTHGGSLTKDVCRAIRRANNYTQFRAYPRKIGETTMGNVSMFFNQSFHETYQDIVSDGPDDRGTGGGRADLFPFQEYTLNGVNILRAPQLDQDSTSPIFGVRHDSCYIQRLPGFWFKEHGFKEKPNAHNSLFAPMDVCGQLTCLDPRGAVWVGHGSF